MKMGYLTQRKGIWYVRVTVPARHRATLNKRHLLETLGTKDRNEAIRSPGRWCRGSRNNWTGSTRANTFGTTHDLRHYMVLFTQSVGAKRSEQIEWSDPVLEFATEFTGFCAQHGITGRDKVEFRNYVIEQARERDAFKAILDKRGRQWMPGYSDIAPQVPPQAQVVPAGIANPAPNPTGPNSLSTFRTGYLEARGFDAKRKLEITRAFRFLERITGDVDLNRITPRHVLETVKLMEKSRWGSS